MRIAICFYGQPRKYKKVLDQWQKLIKELNADVFIHSWYGIDRGRNEIDVNELTKDFNPKEIEISDKHKFIELIPDDATYQNQSYHAMQQAYTISKCFKLLVEHSTDFNKKYDIIIKSRMDIELENVNELINFVKSKIDSDKLYVAGNHWIGASMFDDNIMVAKNKLRWLVNNNDDLQKFWTLTYKENITDLKVSNDKFHKFVMRLNYHYKKNIKYIAVPEIQKKREKSIDFVI